VNGKPQPVDYFDVLDVGEPAARPGVPAGVAEQRRLFLLLFDMAFTSPERLARGQHAAAAMVEQKAPADAFAVATFTTTNGIEMLLQFTTEREAILGTVLTLRPRTAEPGTRVAVIDVDENDMSMSAELARAPIQRLAELGIEGLAELAAALRKIDGFNKHVILISEEFRTGSSARMVPLIEQMQRTFQYGNTFLHSLDAAGLRHTFKAGSGDALRELAVGTGGQWLHNSNDLARSLIDLSESYRRAYILGFRPRSPRAGHNSIVVRVKNLPRGARVVYRKGFSVNRG
jgi:VWFA-related protein